MISKACLVFSISLLFFINCMEKPSKILGMSDAFVFSGAHTYFKVIKNLIFFSDVWFCV